MSAIEKTGDWDGFAKMIAGAASKFRKNIEAATIKNGRLLEQRIVERIQSNQVQPPTSAEFRAVKERYGFSNTTLVMTGSLINAIKFDKKSWTEGFVGVNRNAEQKASARREKKVTKATEKAAKRRARAKAKAVKAREKAREKAVKAREKSKAQAAKAKIAAEKKRAKK